MSSKGEESLTAETSGRLFIKLYKIKKLYQKIIYFFWTLQIKIMKNNE